MAKITTLRKVGIAVVLLSLLVGGLGTITCIYLSFTELQANENAGIGAVGDQLAHAVLFTAGGIVGCVVGLVLLIVGRSKSEL